MSQVVVENLTKIFRDPKGGGIPAVSDLNLTLEEGELLAVLGPSGCGKTTTLRLIAGLEEPTRGTITIDQLVVNNRPPKERDVAMVFQNHALYPHMTVRENMSFGLKLRGFERAEIERRVGEAAEVLGLRDCMERRPAELSGGQHQRVALGRAMVRRPKVFLLDEPLSNLDAPLRAQLRRDLARWHKASGATMIYVTHDQTEAMALGSRLAVIKAGVLQQVGTASEIYGSPANLFVAGFVGTLPMNFFQGTLVQSETGEQMFRAEGKDGFSVWAGGHTIKFVNSPEIEVIMGIRPEEFHNATNIAAETSKMAVDATVEAVEPTGPETRVYARAGEHAILARMPADFRASLGEKVLLGMDTRKAVFFDPDSGARIG